MILSIYFFTFVIFFVFIPDIVDMNMIVERIDSLLKSRNEKRKDLCRGLGMAENNISAWSSRGTIPAADILNDIAIYLDTSIEYLLTGTDKSGFSQKEISLMKSYRRLSDRDKKTIDDLLSSLLSDKQYESNHDSYSNN